MSTWTIDDVYLLKQLYLTNEDKDISIIMNRSTRSVSMKRMKLGLMKRNKEKPIICCLNCSKQFEVICSRQNAKFCSRKCRSEYAKKNSVTYCATCNTKFYAQRNRSRNQYCSMECAGKHRRTGKNLQCDYCGKNIYKKNIYWKHHANFFCGRNCANKFQKIQMIQVTCKVCSKIFDVYPSTIKHSPYQIKYCSLDCRNADPEKLLLWAKMSAIQNRNKARNKLEIAGSRILDSLGFHYQEQYLVNNKICVDIFIPIQNLVIEWWGDYWHGYPTKLKNGVPDNRQKKRMMLDISQRKYLEKCGYKVLTFWEHEVMQFPNAVAQTIETS